MLYFILKKSLTNAAFRCSASTYSPGKLSTKSRKPDTPGKLTPGGTFPKSVGFVSQIHLVKTPLTALEGGEVKGNWTDILSISFKMNQPDFYP